MRTDLGKSGALILVVFALLLAGGPSMVRAADAEDLARVESLMERHGKAAFVEMILEARSGRITIDTGSKLKTSYGPPNQRFVTGRSILADLEAMDASAADLPRLLKAHVAGESQAGQKSGGKAFVVSNQNLATVAARGKINVSGSSSGSSRNPASKSQDASSTSEIHSLEERLTETKENVAAMGAAGESPAKIRAGRLEIQRLEREISEKRRAKPGRDPSDGDSETDSKKAKWTGRYDSIVAEIKRLKKEVVELDRLYEDMMKQYSSWGGASNADKPWDEQSESYEARALKLKLRSLDSQRKGKRSQLQRAEQRLVQLKEDARRDGALPGWFRGRPSP